MRPNRPPHLASWRSPKARCSTLAKSSVTDLARDVALIQRCEHRAAPRLSYAAIVKRGALVWCP